MDVSAGEEDQSWVLTSSAGQAALPLELTAQAPPPHKVAMLLPLPLLSGPLYWAHTRQLKRGVSLPRARDRGAVCAFATAGTHGFGRSGGPHSVGAAAAAAGRRGTCAGRQVWQPAMAGSDLLLNHHFLPLSYAGCKAMQQMQPEG